MRKVPLVFAKDFPQHACFHVYLYTVRKNRSVLTGRSRCDFFPLPLGFVEALNEYLEENRLPCLTLMENMFPVCSPEKMMSFSWIGVRYLTTDRIFLAQQIMKMVFIICNLKKLEGQSLPSTLLTSLSDGLAISIFRLPLLVFITL